MAVERKLYEKCWVCQGTRKTQMVFNEGKANEMPAESPCFACTDGYMEVGMTVGQLEKLVAEREMK